MGNPLRSLLTGLEGSYKQAASEFAQQEHGKDILAREQANELFKEEQKAKIKSAEALKRQETTVMKEREIDQLILGKIVKPELAPIDIRNGFGIDQQTNSNLPMKRVPLTEEEKAKVYSGLDTEGRQSYKEYTELQRKAKDESAETESTKLANDLLVGKVESTAENLGKLTDKGVKLYEAKKKLFGGQKKTDYSRKDGIYEKDILTGKMTKTEDKNPLYVPKHTGTTTGYDSNGNKVMVETYDTGKVVRINTGLNKKDEIEDEAQFDKNMNTHNKSLDEINKMKEAFAKAKVNTPNYPKDAEMATINRINGNIENAERSVYDTMPKEGREKINEYYNYWKKKAKEEGHKPEEVIKDENIVNKESYDKWLEENYSEGKIKDHRVARSLALWSKFKFGYVKPETKNVK